MDFTLNFMELYWSVWFVAFDEHVNLPELRIFIESGTFYSMFYADCNWKVLSIEL